MIRQINCVTPFDVGKLAALVARAVSSGEDATMEIRKFAYNSDISVEVRDTEYKFNVDFGEKGYDAGNIETYDSVMTVLKDIVPDEEQAVILKDFVQSKRDGEKMKGYTIPLCREGE